MEEIQKKKKKEMYVNVSIIEKTRTGVRVKIDSEELNLAKRSFICWEDVELGDTWKLKYDSKSNSYSYFSRLFEKSYYEKKYKENIIYKGSVIRVLGKFYHVRVEKDKYALIYKTDVHGELNIGDSISFMVSLSGNKQRVSGYAAAEKQYRDIIEKEKSEKKRGTVRQLKIHNIEERAKNGSVIGYEYLVEYVEESLYFKIFIFSRQDNQYYDQKNYEIKLRLLLAGNPVYGYFKLFKRKGRVNYALQVELEFKKRLEEEADFFVKFKQNEIDLEDLDYYLEREDIGLARFDTSDYSLAEISLLDTLNNDYVVLELAGRKIKLSPLINPEEELENLEIVKVIRTFSGKVIYQLAISGKDDIRNHRLFIEEEEIDYLKSLCQIGQSFEKLRLKYTVGDIFCFYTRLPYLENPLIEKLQSKEVGDSLIGRVSLVNDHYIEVVFFESYKKNIMKENLKALSKFTISDYYKKDELYEFYIHDISDEKDNITLLGYNPEKIREIVGSLKENEVLECKINQSPNGLWGVYEREGEYIEVKVPNEEISYLSSNIEFKNTIKYRFSYLSYEKYNQKYTLVLSRKRLSSTAEYELKEKYPVGSLLEGIYFTEDTEGFYFNLTDCGYAINMGNLIGYLPYHKISLYPDIAYLRRELLENSYQKYRIVSYPRNMNSYSLKEKAIELVLEKENLTIHDILMKLDLENLVLSIREETKIKILKSEENTLYFEKVIEDTKVIFSILESEFLFERVSRENYLRKLEELYSHLSTKRKEHILYESLFEIFEDNFDKISVSFVGVNPENNTIKVSLKKKMKEIIQKIETPILHDNSLEYLCGDSFLPKVKTLNTEIGEYSYYISEFQEDYCILSWLSYQENILGKVFLVNVMEEREKEYIAKLHDTEIVLPFTLHLFIGEMIYVKILEIKENRAYGEVVSFEKTQEVYKNPVSILEQYLEQNIGNISLEELQDYILKGGDKYKYIPMLEKYKSQILGASSSSKKKEYLFLEEEFSNGAFGKIYFGYNLLNNEKVILKRYSASKDIEEYHSFYHEAKLLHEMNSDILMKVYEYTEDEYIGEFISGRTFREFLNENHSESEKIEICIQIADALDQIHAENIYHLDIKPENIMIDEKQNIKLIDFGCCQSKYEEFGKYGTLLYSSPKQCLGYKNNAKQKYSEKDDIYSFGIMLYETFVGKVPYGNSLGEDGIIEGHLRGRIVDYEVEYRYKNPREVNKEISKRLEEIINHCLDLEEERYDSMMDVLESLEEL